MEKLVRIPEHVKTAFIYPITKEESLEILGYVRENGDTYALVRMSKRREFAKKLLVRYNGHEEPYINTSMCGHRCRLYLSDCKKVIQ